MIKALIWIHSHFETGEVLQLEVLEWYGCRQFLRVLEDHDIGDITECLYELSKEDALRVLIEFETDEGDMYVSSITLDETTEEAASNEEKRIRSD